MTLTLPLARLLGHTADAVQAVRAGTSLNDALARCPAEARPGTQALAFDVLRRLGTATALRARLVPKPPPPAIDALLLSALALLLPDTAHGGPGAGADPEPGTDAGTDAGTPGRSKPDERRTGSGEGGLRYPSHTLVDQAVAAARARKAASAGFVNAVLRRALRERDALLAALADDPVARHNHPRWWIDRLRADWPADWAALLAASHRHPPMTLRPNRRHGGADTYLARLREAGLGAHPLALPGASTRGEGEDLAAIVLDRPAPVGALPGFEAGDVSVQDAGAQVAVRMLLADVPGVAPPPSGARVLDACAAPGGKTAQWLEQSPVPLDLLALDRDPGRLKRVDDTLARLGLAADVRAADAAQPADWWDGRAFQAILLDAPCSASGIVRRHPDVCWLRRPGDIDALVRTQAALLDALWALLAPGGRLLYCTCSVFRAEGQHQIDAFLQRRPDAYQPPSPPSPGHLLPLVDNAGRHGAVAAAPWDGFFHALLIKRPDAPTP